MLPIDNHVGDESWTTSSAREPPSYFATDPAFLPTSSSHGSLNSPPLLPPPPPPPPPAPPLPTFGTNTYANRAANKASGALARFGKAIYGGTTISAPTTPATPFSPAPPSGTVSPKLPVAASTRLDDIKFKTRSEIIAMGPSSTDNAVAIAGKDCMFSSSSSASFFLIWLSNFSF